MIARDSERMGGHLDHQITQEDRPPSVREAALATALEALLELIDHANPDAFKNGVTDQTGSVDQGEVYAADFCRQARAALAMK